MLVCASTSIFSNEIIFTIKTDEGIVYKSCKKDDFIEFSIELHREYNFEKLYLKGNPLYLSKFQKDLKEKQLLFFNEKVFEVEII